MIILLLSIVAQAGGSEPQRKPFIVTWPIFFQHSKCNYRQHAYIICYIWCMFIIPTMFIKLGHACDVVYSIDLKNMHESCMTLNNVRNLSHKVNDIAMTSVTNWYHFYALLGIGTNSS